MNTTETLKIIKYTFKWLLLSGIFVASVVFLFMGIEPEISRTTISVLFGSLIGKSFTKASSLSSGTEVTGLNTDLLDGPEAARSTRSSSKRTTTAATQ